jgi:hypothetical protein
MAGAIATAALLFEIDAIEGWPAERWGQILQRVAEMFISRADDLAPREIRAVR